MASLIGYLFLSFHFADANIIMVYVLAVLIISVITEHRIYSLIASIVSVLLFNFLFTEPRFTLHVYADGYPITFFIMFCAAFLTGTLAQQLKIHAEESERVAFRTQVLLDTNQLLSQAEGKEDIISAAANQLKKLLGRSIIFYDVTNGKLGKERVFLEEGSTASVFHQNGEREVADWVVQNKKNAGDTTEWFPDAKCLYLAVRVNENVYGIIGIASGEKELEPFENGILFSILGECALALENEKVTEEKEEAAILAQNEQLRYNLLRSISHDLRTPLTSISGNASNLLSNGDYFDRETRIQLYGDIYEESLWLIHLVENLLSVTRLEEKKMNLNLSVELVDEVITEALRHVSPKAAEHQIATEEKEEFLLATMDAGLIVQVIINLVDNAVKYTPTGSHILISSFRRGTEAVVSVSDDGPGIPDEAKPHVFEMFYTGSGKIADSHRSMGLGLSLCKSIIQLHGGQITVSDAYPHGAVFQFTLPAGEVNHYE